MLRVWGETGESVFMRHARYKIRPHLRASGKPEAVSVPYSVVTHLRVATIASPLDASLLATCANNNFAIFRK